MTTHLIPFILPTAIGSLGGYYEDKVELKTNGRIKYIDVQFTSYNYNAKLEIKNKGVVIIPHELNHDLDNNGTVSSDQPQDLKGFNPINQPVDIPVKRGSLSARLTNDAGTSGAMAIVILSIEFEKKRSN